MTSVSYHHPSHREMLAELLQRLRRVRAATATVESLTNGQATTPTMLADTLEGLERDLLLAAREAADAAARIRR